MHLSEADIGEALTLSIPPPEHQRWSFEPATRRQQRREALRPACDASYMGFTLREVRIQSVTRLDSDDKSSRRSLDEVTFTYEGIEWLKR